LNKSNTPITDEESLLRKIFEEGPSKLKHELPTGYMDLGMGKNPYVDALLNQLVVETNKADETNSIYGHFLTQPNMWPGPETNVSMWWKLDSGHCVGWIILPDDWLFKVIDP
jgi:hypothetical protein